MENKSKVGIFVVMGGLSVIVGIVGYNKGWFGGSASEKQFNAFINKAFSDKDAKVYGLGYNDFISSKQKFLTISKQDVNFLIDILGKGALGGADRKKAGIILANAGLIDLKNIQ